MINDEFQKRLYEYIGGIIRAQKGYLGGIEDHVHLLTNLSPAQSISDTLREIKTNSSKWCNECLDISYRFEWQKGYGAFTVSYSQIEPVRRYIQNQRDHHRTKTFEEEYIDFLRLHNISFDHKYLFEMEYHG